MDRKLLLASTVAGMLAVSFSAGLAWADDDSKVGPLVRATGLSPFGALENCGSNPGLDGNQPGGVGRNFTNIEVEPWVVANPEEDDNIVAFWQQDRWSNGGNRGNTSAVSFDGGETWKIVVIPGMSECSGGPFERTSDPWLDFSPDGTLHQMSLVFDNSPDPNAPFGTQRNGMAVSKSTDGGLTWSDPILVIDEDNPNVLSDKNMLTADPHDSNLVYTVWDRLEVFPNGDYHGPTYIARSTDGGDSYEPAHEIYNPGINNQTIGNQIVVLPDGTLVDTFNEIIAQLPDGSPNPNPPFSVALIRSYDKGVTWEQTSTKVDSILAVSTRTPDTNERVRDANIILDNGVDPKKGTLYVVWTDARFLQPDLNINQIAMSVSKDGGDTWSAPVRVNKTPANATNPARQTAFLPSVEVNKNGDVAITYYDFRNDEDGTRELADHFMIICRKDCDDPANFKNEIRLTDESFDYREAADTGGGFFLGDYMGLEASGNEFLSFFHQSFPTKDADGYFRKVRKNAKGAVGQVGGASATVAEIDDD